VLLGTAILRNVPLLAGLADSELDLAASSSRRLKYPKKSIVFQEGDPGDFLLVILRGRVKVTLLGEEGRETIVAILEPPAFLGEVALLDESPRSATVMTLEATEQIRTLSLFDVHGRVLRCLLVMGQGQPGSTATRMLIRPSPSVKDLALMVGCSRETVSRSLKVLQATGYVTVIERGLAIEQRAIRQYLLPALQNLMPKEQPPL